MSAKYRHHDTYIDNTGQILEIHNLEPHECNKCEQTAVLLVARSNKGLPPNYIQSGSRNVYYCAEHTPDDVKAIIGEMMQEVRLPYERS